MSLFAFLPNIGTPEMLILGVVAVLLFGSRLPQVARNLGKGVTEFKKGLRGIETDIDTASNDRRDSSYEDHIDDHEQPTAPRFDPPTSEPREVAEATATQPAQPA
jgi:sec-independent protein translocase protein TatA